MCVVRLIKCGMFNNKQSGVASIENTTFYIRYVLHYRSTGVLPPGRIQLLQRTERGITYSALNSGLLYHTVPTFVFKCTKLIKCADKKY